MKKKFCLALPFLTVALAATSLLHAQTTVETSTSATSAGGLNSMGTISEFGPEMITIRSESSAAPVQYTASKTTTYVDETGAPVSMEMVKSGLPATVYYTQVGGQMVASRVVVRRTTTTTAPVTPVVEEKRTTTTTTTEQ